MLPDPRKTLSCAKFRNKILINNNKKKSAGNFATQGCVTLLNHCKIQNTKPSRGDIFMLRVGYTPPLTHSSPLEAEVAICILAHKITFVEINTYNVRKQ